MATHSEYSVTVPQPIAKVHQALSSEEFWKYNVAHLSPEPGQVHSFDGEEAVLYEVLPVEVLPEAVRSMISQSLKVKRVVTVGPLQGEKAEMDYTADVKGTPVSYEGEVFLTGEGDTTTFDYDSKMNVNIPIMGAAIEPKVAAALGDIFEHEGELLNTWITENL